MAARQILSNRWALRSTYTATELTNLLRQFIHADDRILVAEMGSEWASRKALANLGEV